MDAVPPSPRPHRRVGSASFTAAATALVVALTVLGTGGCTGTTSATRSPGSGTVPALGDRVAARAPARSTPPTPAAAPDGGPTPTAPPSSGVLDGTDAAVITAAGTFAQATPFGWRLTMAIPGGHLLVLGDRPGHGATHPTVLEFVDAWAARGPGVRPPTAALTGTTTDGTAVDLAVQVADPAWNAADSTLMVTVRGVGVDRDAVLPPAFAALALHLDDARDPVTIELVNGSGVALHIDGALPDLSAWSADPAPGADAAAPFGPSTASGDRRTLSLPASATADADGAGLVVAGDDGSRFVVRLRRDGHGGSAAVLVRDAGWSVLAPGLPVAPIGEPVPVPPAGPGSGGGTTYVITFADAP